MCMVLSEFIIHTWNLNWNDHVNDISHSLLTHTHKMVPFKPLSCKHTKIAPESQNHSWIENQAFKSRTMPDDHIFQLAKWIDDVMFLSKNQGIIVTQSTTASITSYAQHASLFKLPLLAQPFTPRAEGVKENA